MAALRWPRPSKQPDAPQGTPYVVWSDHLQRPGPPGQTCSCPIWAAREQSKDGDSSVSSGRLSGSSGGHKSCAPPHKPWKERPSQLLGSPRQHRKSSPRLELLRDRIRAQAHGQASCASLGTSLPSSASHTLGASAPAPQRKVRRLKKPPPAPAYPDSGDLSAAERGAADKASAGQECEPSGVSQRQASVRREKTKSTRSRSCRREKAPTWSPSRAAKDKGDTEKEAAESPTSRPRMPRPASVRSDPQVSANMPHLAACDQMVTIHSAMAILQDLRQQIQTGLELAQDRHLRGARECRPAALWQQELAGRRRQGLWTAPAVKTPLSKSPRAPTKGTRSSSERTGSFPAGLRWSTLGRCESYPQRTWSAQGRDPTFQRPGSPPERLGYFPQRPWSASAGQRAWASSEDSEAPAPAPWHPVDSASCIKRAGTPFKGRGSLLPPWGGKNTWPRPAQSTPRMAPGKENEARPPPPCPKPRGLLGHAHSPESLRQVMRQKALARRQQALEEKASAMRALGLTDQRLQDVYRSQREAILAKAVPSKAVPTKAFPVVSQTTPSIVTFVPHSAPSGDLEASGGLGPPALQWSKVTSGMVLGDQEAPGSFCLCLDRALNRDETLETGGPQEGWEGAPLLLSASSSRGPLELQDLTPQHTRPGLCIYLDPEEAERLGTPGPLHFRYKQARLQALETMANILKRRIDILTSKLLRSEEADTLEDLVSELPPPRPSTVPAAPTPAAPAGPGALVPNGSRGAPWGRADMPARPLLSPTCFPDGEMLLWGPRGHPARKPRGSMEEVCSELGKRLARDSASFQVLSPLARSSHRVPAPPDPTCGSLWLEEMPTARGVGLATPWTLRSCSKGKPADRPWAGWWGGWGGPTGTPSTACCSSEVLRV